MGTGVWWHVLVVFAALCPYVLIPVRGDAGSILPPTKLVRKFYKLHGQCNNTELFVRQQVKMFWNKDHSLTPKLLRLLYSDCFVSGCDASILLDGPNSEKKAPQNSGLGAFVVIDKIKTVLETLCPGVVSCADIVQLATRDAVALSGGPSYIVLTGRRDGLQSNAASVDLPSPSISQEAGLAYFKSRGLNVIDYTTLLGAHTMGRTHCRYIDDRLYNYKNTGKPDPSMSPSLLTQLRKQCPPKLRKGQTDPLVFLNPSSGSSYKFTNSYYSRVLTNQSVLTADQQLHFGEDSSQIADEFAHDIQDFKKSFALSMTRLGSVKVLTGTQGEIRKTCRSTNH